MIPKDHYIDIGFKMHVREWQPAKSAEYKQPFLLVHGLASNAHTWDEVAERLAVAGHAVVAVDQRGHGRSDKPTGGYDFATITQDLFRLLDQLAWQKPILAGQSWGGNVLLEFGAQFPGRAKQLIFVDGGFLNLRHRGSWKKVAEELRPPNLIGTPRSLLATRIKKNNPGWSDTGIEASLHNFETLPDGTVRPWLTLERHMQILQALYAQNTIDLFNKVQEPVLICVADDGSEWATSKRISAQQAIAGLKRAEVVYFFGAAHDIHIDRPVDLAMHFLQFADQYKA